VIGDIDRSRQGKALHRRSAQAIRRPSASGLSRVAAARQFNATPKTVTKWVDRFRAERRGRHRRWTRTRVLSPVAGPRSAAAPNAATRLTILPKARDVGRALFCGQLSMWRLRFSASRSSKIIATNSERVSWQCRVAGKTLRSSRPPQNRTCEFPRIRLKHLPAYRVSAVLVFVLDGTSGGREHGFCLRWRRHDAPQR
jgi:hypothetical protein